MAADIITQTRLKTLVSYDKTTGVFTRLVSNSGYTKVGDEVGSKQISGYLAAQLDGKKYLVHRLAWLYVYGDFPEEHIDHINGIRIDNRICNLRTVNHIVNGQNRNKSNSGSVSGLLGVCWSKDRNMWLAQIKLPNSKSNKNARKIQNKRRSSSSIFDSKKKIS